MNIQLIRKSFTPKATEGVLSVNGLFECYTLEDTDRKLESGGLKVQDKTCIPRGKYEVVINFSPHFNRLLPQVLNVPQFEGIRIHSGNSDADTDGCILVGASNSSLTDDWIGGSRLAFDKLFAEMQESIKHGEKITLEVL